MRVIDADALFKNLREWQQKLEDTYGLNDEYVRCLDEVLDNIDDAPTIDTVPVKFIDDVIEYLTKCRDYAIHEETKTSWDEQRQTLIMLLHEWAAWNECGRTGKYGERRTHEP